MTSGNPQQLPDSQRVHLCNGKDTWRSGLTLPCAPWLQCAAAGFHSADAVAHRLMAKNWASCILMCHMRKWSQNGALSDHLCSNSSPSSEVFFLPWNSRKSFLWSFCIKHQIYSREICCLHIFSWNSHQPGKNKLIPRKMIIKSRNWSPGKHPRPFSVFQDHSFFLKIIYLPFKNRLLPFPQTSLSLMQTIFKLSSL